MTTTLLLSISIFTSLADSLFHSGYYELARIEYKREFYFHPELTDRREKRLNYALSLCYADYDISYFELHRFISDFKPLDSHENKALANSLIYLGDYYGAKDLLAETDDHRLLAYAYILNREWNQARELLYEKNDTSLAMMIDRFTDQKLKNPRTAMFLSAFCPGAGETYAGDCKTGIKAFLVNIGSGLLLYNAINKKKYVDAALIFNFLFQRFYFGSIFNARHLAMQYNEELEREYRHQFENLIE